MQQFPTDPRADRSVTATGTIQRTISGKTYQIRGTEEQLMAAIEGRG